MKTWFTLLQTRLITVRAHYTWVILLLLGGWSLARLVLPERMGEDAQIWTATLAIMFTYIGCVMIHEAGHILAARLLGVPMPHVNLHPIGSLARRGPESAGPGRTFVVATAGPVASIGLWLALRAIDTTPGTLADTILAYARSFSLTIGLINLLPGLPLDGGRMLRSLIWLAVDFAAATRFASLTGYLVAAGTLLFGLRTMAAPDGLLRGMWIVLLAWLMYAAGASLNRRRTLGTLFQRLTVGDVMRPAERTAAPETSLRDLVTTWRGATGELATPIVHNDLLLGLVTRSAISAIPQGYWDERTLGEVMTPAAELLTFAPRTSLAAILPLIDRNADDALPLLVVDNARLLGVLDPRDLAPMMEVQDTFAMHTLAAPSAAHDQPGRSLLRGRTVRSTHGAA